jgi:hypothetical protein
MTDLHENKLPIWFWVVSGLMLAWNLMGVMAYVVQITMSPETLAALPEAEQAMYTGQPAWYVGAFAIAVFAGACGCIGLLLRKKWSLPLFIASFIAVILQHLYVFVTSDIGKMLKGTDLIMPVMIPVIAIFLVWFSWKCAAKGWLK